MQEAKLNAKPRIESCKTRPISRQLTGHFHANTHEKLEKRLARLENRFAALMVKSTKTAARTLYLMMKSLEDHTKSTKEQIDKYWYESKHYAELGITSSKTQSTITRMW